MRWLEQIKWWLHIYREVGRLQGEVTRYVRLWKSADQQRLELAAALKDCADAGLAAITERDALISQLAMRIARLTANQGLLVRYVSALNVERITPDMIVLVEALKVGIYRSEDGRQIMVTYKALSEEDGAGWDLLDTQEAVKELSERMRMAMGVWN